MRYRVITTMPNNPVLVEEFDNWIDASIRKKELCAEAFKMGLFKKLTCEVVHG